jgi:hypothetical protein
MTGAGPDAIAESARVRALQERWEDAWPKF